MKRYDPEPFFARLSAVGMSQRELARRLGVHDSTVALWVRKGVGENYADQAAVIVGLTPANLWPEWIDDEMERLERLERRRAADKMAALRASNPEYAERQRAYARRWKAESAEYVRSQRRAYYLANRDKEIRAAVERKRRQRQEAS